VLTDFTATNSRPYCRSERPNKLLHGGATLDAVGFMSIEILRLFERRAAGGNPQSRPQLLQVAAR